MTDQLQHVHSHPIEGEAESARLSWVIGGVDTHTDTHHAAVIDDLGARLGDASFAATPDGYAALLAWLASFGMIRSVGMEGTASYGAGLARHLAERQVTVIEVNTPDRQQRRRAGKSDPLDAYTAADAVAAGRATATPKAVNGAVEAIRAIRTVRGGAVKSRAAAINQLHNLIVTSIDESLRSKLSGLTRAKQVAACRDFDADPDEINDPAHALRAALHSLADRIHDLDTQISKLDRKLAHLTQALAPNTLAVFGVGPDTAGQLLTTAGDNPQRLTGQAALAALTGTSPLPASSGRTDKHRLNRGGDRQANKALHQVIIVRMRHHEPTRAYVHKRTQEGLTKKDIKRCLKRYLVREIYRAITTDLTPNTT